MADQTKPDLMTEQELKTGYRQGLITSITVLLTASLLFFRFAVFEQASGPWTNWGTASALLVGISILLQLYALWRALQPEDEQISIYKVTLNWFAVAMVLLVLSFVAHIVTSLVY
jgi:hypothetical protein